jgi:hypothetical protein
MRALDAWEEDEGGCMSGSGGIEVEDDEVVWQGVEDEGSDANGAGTQFTYFTSK